MDIARASDDAAVSASREYSIAEVAALKSVSARTVRRWIEDGLRSGGARGLWPVRRYSAQMVRIPECAVIALERRHTL